MKVSNAIKHIKDINNNVNTSYVLISITPNHDDWKAPPCLRLSLAIV